MTTMFTICFGPNGKGLEVVPGKRKLAQQVVRAGDVSVRGPLPLLAHRTPSLAQRALRIMSPPEGVIQEWLGVNGGTTVALPDMSGRGEYDVFQTKELPTVGQNQSWVLAYRPPGTGGTTHDWQVVAGFWAHKQQLAAWAKQLFAHPLAKALMMCPDPLDEVVFLEEDVAMWDGLKVVSKVAHVIHAGGIEHGLHPHHPRGCYSMIHASFDRWQGTILRLQPTVWKVQLRQRVGTQPTSPLYYEATQGDDARFVSAADSDLMNRLSVRIWHNGPTEEVECFFTNELSGETLRDAPRFADRPEGDKKLWGTFWSEQAEWEAFALKHNLRVRPLSCSQGDGWFFIPLSTHFATLAWEAGATKTPPEGVAIPIDRSDFQSLPRPRMVGGVRYERCGHQFFLLDDDHPFNESMMVFDHPEASVGDEVTLVSGQDPLVINASSGVPKIAGPFLVLRERGDKQATPGAPRRLVHGPYTEECTLYPDGEFAITRKW